MSCLGRPPILCFDIETLPDARAIRAQGLSDAQDDTQAIEQARQKRRDETGSDFLPISCQKVLVLSGVLRTPDALEVFSLEVTPECTEAQVVQEFFNLIDTHCPQLVSWNGKAFDMPVLNLRAMLHGVVAAQFWEQGEGDREFKYNNYVSRYHARHTDVMDVLSLYNTRASAKLDVMARLCGFPGKVGGVDGSQVYATWLAGQQAIVRKYCETDVMNTYLLYMRYLLVSGKLSPEDYSLEMQFVVDTLDWLLACDPQENTHWDQFLGAWVGGSTRGNAAATESEAAESVESVEAGQAGEPVATAAPQTAKPQSSGQETAIRESDALVIDPPLDGSTRDLLRHLCETEGRKSDFYVLDAGAPRNDTSNNSNLESALSNA